MYKLERGRELPPSAHYLHYGKWKILAADMLPGDSVSVETEEEARSLGKAIRAIGWGAARRAMLKKGEKIYRVWRTS
jgi:hypothetical protein|tara:strand:+ start:646 stop:876 length:231 start_codon:yes stop_codon:yes gene_type:complete